MGSAGSNSFANRDRAKSPYVADSKGWRQRDIPHPVCFAQRVWICLILKELILGAATKSSEEYGNKRVGANYRRKCFEVTHRRVSQLGYFEE
jgi:hypothetical protein